MIEPEAAAEPASPAASPGAERTLSIFATAIEACRLDDALACFAEDARFVTPDGTVVVGSLQIRSMIRQVLAMPSSTAIESERAIEFDQTAIATQIWTMRFRGPDESHHDRISTATLALRRTRPSWRITLVAPWGLAGGQVS